MKTKVHIEPIAFVTLDEESFTIIRDSDVTRPVAWKGDVFLGISVAQADALADDTDEPATVRKLLRAIVNTARSQGHDGYLFICMRKSSCEAAA